MHCHCSVFVYAHQYILIRLLYVYVDAHISTHSAFVKASTAALLKTPDVNGYIDGTDIVYRDYVDISVAVSTPTGLVVPVLRNTESMCIHPSYTGHVHMRVYTIYIPVQLAVVFVICMYVCLCCTPYTRV